MVVPEDGIGQADGVDATPQGVASLKQRCVSWQLVVPGFLRWFLPFAAAILAIGYFMAAAELEHQQQLRDTKAEERIVLAAKDIELQFRAVVSDLRFLAGADSLHRFLRNAPGSRSALGRDMRNFAVSAASYDQIRFIDKFGDEQIRIGYNNGLAREASRHTLQNKKHRYYFTDSLALAQGQVFVSPLDLNVEHGKIEQPLKPTIRFGIAVFDTNGNKAGVVILNYLAKNTLDGFQTLFASDQGQLYLLNKEGYFLSSPNKEDTWGFMIKGRQDDQLKTREAALWARLNADYAGSFNTSDARYIYARIHPLWEGLRSSAGSNNLFGRSHTDVPPNEYYWTIVARYPPLTIADIVGQPSLIWFIAVALATAAVSAWLVAREAQHERAHVKQLRRYRDHLEEQVAVRTAELARSSSRMELLLDSTAEGIIGTDRYGNCVFANFAGLSLLAYSDEAQMLGNDIRQHIAPLNHTPDAAPAGRRSLVDSVIESGCGVHLDDGLIVTRDGDKRPADIRIQPMMQDEQVSGLVVSFVDISANKDAEQRIRILSQAVEQSPVSVIITDPQGMIEFVNAKFEAVSGYTAGDVVGRDPSFLRSDNDLPQTDDEIRRMLEAGHSWHGEMHNQRSDGSRYWVRTHIAPVCDTNKQLCHLLRIDEDITQYKEQEQKIVQQAHYDFLTGLPNRLLAMDRLGQLIKKAARDSDHVVAMFLDLDDFKKINDTFGHEVGDQLLVEASRRLSGAIRDQDTVSRLGGDEFLVILGTSTRDDSASTIAEHLLDKFRAPFLLNGHEIVVTVSIGIALFPNDGETTSSLLRSADIAMYQAKRFGANTYQYFASSMNEEIERRLHIEARLRHALRRGDIQVHYQPIVSLDGDRLIGAEALMRWHDAELGQMPPDEFIPVAEQTGMIEELGAFVLEEAVTQCTVFRQRFGTPFHISVNASPSQFRDAEFARYVESALLRAQLPPSALVLEVTEGVLLSGNPQVDDILDALHRLQVRLALDDFGTGYASLAYLRRYPFDMLKIDREFVRDMSTDNNDRELVRAAVRMAQALELEVVAEGVETRDQIDALREWNCGFAQGYYFGKPCAPTSFDRPNLDE